MGKNVSNFESGLTPRAMILALAPLLVALLMIYNGVFYLNKFPGSRNLPWLVLFSILPLAFGAALIGTTLFLISKNMGRKLAVSDDGVTYSHGKDGFSLSWALTAFSMPRGGKLYRVLAITDGKNVVRVEDLFFKDFDLIAKAVSDAKNARR